MSPYHVEHHGGLSEVPVYHCADILWSENPLIRNTGHTFRAYRDLLVNEVVGSEGLVCTCNGFTVGAIVIGPQGMDSHFPGLGRIVYYSVTSKRHPGATVALYRALTALLVAEGSEWYQTSRRRSLTEFTSKFRRVHRGA
ncbi:hypothetical protein Ep4_032 [Pseudomonas phage Ep4]|uniref:Uncharacterized protein n=1 Tax=Pseudomonas phage Ep4 TaxID=3057492 RepID=A0AAU9ECA4_9CAUD|nr:hypothetical protein Ep4_032 [Pseudomonas phage Ep4]